MPRPQGHTAVSIDEIAERLHMKRGTVASLLSRGMRKLKSQPGAFEALLALHRANTLRTGPQCGSIECRQDWIELYGDHFELD